MFEKEAKQYGDNYIKSKYMETVDETWRKGAEFGYNKVNEWHDLKTERPQLRKEVLWLIDNKLWLGELLESRIDFDEWELDSVLFNDYEIRWKENVLPELKEIE